MADNLLLFDDRVCVPDDPILKNLILHSRHDHVTAGHQGRGKTLKMVRQKYHWKGIKQYVDDYVDGCHKCQRVKTIRHKPYGLLKPLTAPDQPWTHITMDFIDQLPLSSGYDAIFVVVDRLTKMAIFMCTTTKVTSGFNPTLEINLAPNTKEAHGVEISRIKEVHEHAKREIIKAQATNQKYANQHRLPTHEGFQKFADRRLGPYKILALVGTHAARLELPNSMSRIHPVFHFAYLEPAALDTIAGRRPQPPGPIIVADQEDEYEVSAILDSRRISHKTVQYLVEWFGYENSATERES
ncbi:hypothetical protein RQP46_005762 [Phenoliferia psychrophenolica]